MGIQPGFGGQPGRLAIKAKFFGNFASGDCLLQAALVNARNPKGPASLDIGKIRVAMPGRMSNGGDLVIKPVVRRAGAPTAITALAFTNPQGPATVFSRPLTISAITAANPAVVTVGTATAWVNADGSTSNIADGDLVQLSVIATGTAAAGINAVFRVGNYSASTFRLQNVAGTAYDSSAGLTLTPGTTSTIRKITANAQITTTVVTHGLLPGEQVRVRGVLGATQLNTTTTDWTVASVTGVDTFVLQTTLAALSAFTTSADSRVETLRPLADLTVSSVAMGSGATARQVVFTTSAAHGLRADDTVYVTGTCTSTPAWSSSYVPVSVVAVPSTTTLTLNLPQSFTAAASAATMTLVVQRSMRLAGNLTVEAPVSIGLASVGTTTEALFTTNQSHNFKVGDQVQTIVLGTSVTALNGLFRVRTVPLATTFTLETQAGIPVSGTGSTPTANSGHVSGMMERITGVAYDGEGTLEFNVSDTGPTANALVGPLKF
jgi:hypothetical protein